MKKSSSGQVLLLVVITMIVALTAGLSLASRTLTNLKVSKQNKDSQKAFQAASAGVNKYLQTNCTEGDNCADILQPLTNISTNVKTVTGTQVCLNNQEIVDQDRGIDLWLSTYPTYASPYTGTVTIYWGTSGTLNCDINPVDKSRVTPALEIVYLSGTVANPILTKRVFDPCSNSAIAGSVNRGNSFEIPASTP